MKQQLSGLIPTVKRLWQQFGDQPPLPGLKIVLRENPMTRIHSVYQPSFCVVLQGAKSSSLADQNFHYRAGQCLLATVDIPVTANIVEASANKPYIAFSVVLDPAIVSELLIDESDIPHGTPPRTALHTATLPEELYDPLQRLLALVTQPRDHKILLPLLQREIVWRLLHSDLREQLLHIGLQESSTARIALATAWLRDHFREPVRVSELADLANMSVASFHRHFKSLTQMTPVQFQKQMRLQEARVLLLKQEDVSAVGYSVGYESPSQFSRDYRRLFGVPPGQDRQTIRAELRSHYGRDSMDSATIDIASPVCE